MRLERAASFMSLTRWFLSLAAFWARVREDGEASRDLALARRKASERGMPRGCLRSASPISKCRLFTAPYSPPLNTQLGRDALLLGRNSKPASAARRLAAHARLNELVTCLALNSAVEIGFVDRPIHCLKCANKHATKAVDNTTLLKAWKRNYCHFWVSRSSGVPASLRTFKLTPGSNVSSATTKKEHGRSQPCG